jgi:DNA-directed RNA polymerase specialized sigma24 family protein
LLDRLGLLADKRFHIGEYNLTSTGIGFHDTYEPSRNPYSGRSGAGISALDSGLTALEKLDPRKCKAVELRYLGGLSMEEIAQTLEVSPITVRRDLRMAEAWLHQEMKDS